MTVKKVVVEISEGIAMVSQCPEGVVVLILDHDKGSDTYLGMAQDIIDAKFVDKAVDQAEELEKLATGLQLGRPMGRSTGHNLETNMHAQREG